MFEERRNILYPSFFLFFNAHSQLILATTLAVSFHLTLVMSLGQGPRSKFSNRGGGRLKKNA